jgi:hypothetical protein
MLAGPNKRLPKQWSRRRGACSVARGAVGPRWDVAERHRAPILGKSASDQYLGAARPERRPAGAHAQAPKAGARVCGGFLQRLLKQMAGKIYLIVDGHPVHTSGTAMCVAANHSSRPQLIRLPGFCPALIPDEWLNQDVKTNGLGKSRQTSQTELIAIVRRHVYRRQKYPQVFTNLFREQHVHDATR